MRKLFVVALAVALGASLAQAQRGGGHGFASGGHGSGFAFSGRSFGPGFNARGQFTSTPGQQIVTPGQSVITPGRSIYTPGQMVITPGQMSLTAPRVLTPFARGGDGAYGAGRYGARAGYRSGYGYRGHRVPYLFGGGAWLDPYGLDYDDDSDYDNSGGQAATDQAAQSQGYPPPGYDAGPGYGPAYGYGPEEADGSQYRPDYNTAPASAPNVVQSQEPTLTVVLRNGQTEPVRNYAVTATALIDLDNAASGHEQTIPLDQINLAATENAAAQAGLTFSVPKS
jgi:hypothetical protein